MLYQQANPLFKKFTDRIDLSWINAGWLLFALLGVVLIYGLLSYKNVKDLDDLDLKADYAISGKREDFTGSKNIPKNTVMALTLFSALNMMLLFINLLDLDNLFFSGKLPNGVTLSDLVHNAVWSLVVSILIAVGFIVRAFKDELNFNRHVRQLKFLIYLWIFQSALMVVSVF